MICHSVNTWRVLLLGIILVAQFGCAGKNLLNWNQNTVPHADERNPVRKVVCIWEPVHGQGLDGLPTRGFAGQIMFFTHGSPMPATSDGDVRVILYDDRGTREEQVKPIHQFDFPAAAWATHLQESTPGPSYQIFIPYVAKHPWPTTCGLRVRLTAPNNGPIVYSEMVYVRLTGPTEKKSSEDATANPQPKLPGLSPDISEFQFGAVLNHRDGVTGTDRSTAAPRQASLIERAMHVTTPDQHKSAGPTKSSSPIRLTSAQQQAQPLIDPATETDDEAKIQHFEQMLRQLRQKQRQKQKLPAGPDATSVELPKKQRFQLSPANSNSRWNDRSSAEPSQQRSETTIHPLEETARGPHPLEGL